MPIYEYKPLTDTPCTHCSSGFEVLQKLSEPPFGFCPECGTEVRKVLSAPSVPRSDQTLAPDNLERHGFTQYKRSSQGEYVKTAGKGPRTISGDE